MLGERDQTFNITIEPSKTDKPVTTFDFKSNLGTAFEKIAKKTLTLPEMRIKSISPTGLLIIEFSEAIIVLEDLSRLQDKDWVFNGEAKTNV